MSVKLSEWQIENLARFFVTKLDEIVKYYEDPENEKKYQEWYFNRYGKYPNEEENPNER